VLPDHLHAVWSPPGANADFPLRWSLIRKRFSRGLPRAATPAASKIRKHETGIWQRRYWEHTIRDDADLDRNIDYIHFNPVKHGRVSKASDWPYTSFHRSVKRGLLQRIGAAMSAI